MAAVGIDAVATVAAVGDVATIVATIVAVGDVVVVAVVVHASGMVVIHPPPPPTSHMTYAIFPPFAGNPTHHPPQAI